MFSRKSNAKPIDLLPILGIFLFAVLYLFSAMLYPGGSQADPNSSGFDWVHNYWCNLMNEKAMNGLENPARPLSITAMIILCLSLLAFFIQCARVYAENGRWKQIIILSGTLSMITSMLIFTSYHDLMTTLSCIFGLFTVIGIIRGVYKNGRSLFKTSGVICLLLLALNNYIYYSEQLIETLPLLQKITFAFVLIWVIGLNVEMIRKKQNQ